MLSSQPAFAIENVIIDGESNPVISNNSIMPIYDYSANARTLLSISTSGDATIVGSLQGYDSTSKVKIYLYLQKKVGSSWTTIESTSTTINDSSASLQGTFDVDTGYSYRVKGSYYAYEGANYEHITTYSGTIKY